MRMACICAIVLLAPSGIVAQQDWQPLDGAEIQAALADRTVEYDSATQQFFASGRSSYDTGQVAWGYWRVEQDAYCSQWPPADGWVCYDVERSADGVWIRFTGASGASSEGHYLE